MAKHKEKAKDQEESLKHMFQEEEIAERVKDMRTWKGAVTYLAHYEEYKPDKWKPICPFCGADLTRPHVDYGSVRNPETSVPLTWFKSKCAKHGDRFLIKYFITPLIPQTVPVYLRDDEPIRISDDDDEWPLDSEVVEDGKPRLRAGQKDPEAIPAKRGRPKHTLTPLMDPANPFSFRAK